MKKNLISILILALMVVNVVLTAITMFSVTSTNKKTAALVNDIASVLSLELSSTQGADGENTEVVVSMEDTVPYAIEDEMTIMLKQGEDGKDHYAVVSVSLAMNSKDKDYKTYGETIGDNVSLIKGEINDVFASHTLEEARGNEEQIQGEILTRIQEMFDSQFVYKVTFSSIVYQ
ncbi:MAG: flagellar basal body-associated FliL family protein [Lachnospiraceae bacterium]|nr:flagellar basal body-associated FliL family protein [Lachnospiraceae bacterium]